jgi:hypothetical protein
MINNLLKEYVTKRLLLENKPYDQRTLIDIFEFRYNSIFSKVTNNYEKMKVEQIKERFVKKIKEEYPAIRIYSAVFLKELMELCYLASKKSGYRTIEELREILSYNMPNIIDLLKKHKDRVWSYLNYKEKDKIITGKSSYEELEGQYEFCLSKKLLPAEEHVKVIKNNTHGEVIFEDNRWVFVRPKTKIGSLAWATSYHDGSKEDLRSDLKDKVSWCTASFGDNYWSNYSKSYILIYCIAKNYEKNSPHRKITIGFNISEAFNYLFFIDHDSDVTQDANNEPLSKSELSNLVSAETLKNLSDKVRKICVLEKGAIDTRLKRSIDRKIEEVLEDEDLDYDEASSKIKSIFENILDESSIKASEADTLSILNYLSKSCSGFFVDKDLNYLERKYNIVFEENDSDFDDSIGF